MAGPILTTLDGAATPSLRYAITDRIHFTGTEARLRAALVDQAARLGLQGVEFLQLREKDMAAGALAELARNILSAIQAAGATTRLLINGRVDVAVVAGTDGVHLTATDGELTPAQVRTLFAGGGLPQPIVSVSCHTLADVSRARDAGADLILFGPVFEKRVGDQFVADGTGLNLLRSVCAAAAPMPVFALGGITHANAAGCLTAGAAGIAGIRLFLNELDSAKH